MLLPSSRCQTVMTLDCIELACYADSHAEAHQFGVGALPVAVTHTHTAPLLPPSRASTEGRSTRKANKIGVRLWTACCGHTGRNHSSTRN